MSKTCIKTTILYTNTPVKPTLSLFIVVLIKVIKSFLSEIKTLTLLATLLSLCPVPQPFPVGVHHRDVSTWEDHPPNPSPLDRPNMGLTQEGATENHS